MVTLPRAARRPSRSSVSAMAASRPTPRSRARAASRSYAETIQLENVVGGAHQRPFSLHLLEPAQQELPEAARVLDLSDDRFDEAFARRVGGSAGLREQLPRHAVDDRRVGGQRTSRTRAWPLAMFLLPCRDVRVDGRGRDRGQALIRAIARVR